MSSRSVSSALASIQRWIGNAEFEAQSLEAIRRSCGGEKALLVNHSRDAAMAPSTLTPFLTDDERARYARDYAADNPFLATINVLPVGVVRPTSSMLPMRQYRKLRYFEWATRFYGAYEVGSVVSRTGTDAIAIGFSRTLVRGDFTREQTMRLRSLVRPFRRAYLLHRRLRDGSSPYAPHANTLLDLTDPFYACFAIDVGRLIVETNEGGDDHLVDARTVLSSSGRLRFRNDEAQRLLENVLRQDVASATISLPGPGLPVASATVIRMNDMQLPASTHAARWLVFLPVLQQTRTFAHVVAFADEHSLTDTEMRVLEHLVQGLDLPSIAAHIGHSLETCRSMLKRIFQKSGTRRQAELVAKVLT